MAKTFWMFNPNQDKHGVTGEKADFLVTNPQVSALIDLTTTGAVNAIYVPAGTIVTRVGVLGKVAISGGSPDIDVGDGTTSDLYIDGLSVLAADQIKWGGVGGTAGADPNGGKYYSAAGYIIVTRTAASTAGSCYVIAYFDKDDTGTIDW